MDWIRDIETGELQFILFDGAKYEVGDTVQFGEENFDLPELDPDILSAVALPNGTSDYGTTQKLFADTRAVFTNHGIADDVALAATHFTFATWFPDTHRPAPAFVFTGPPAEGSLLLHLLSLVVRRSVVLVEADSLSVRQLVEQIHPTFLVDSRSFSSRGVRMLLGSRLPHTYVGRKGSLRNFAAATALYLDLDTIKGNIVLDFSLNVSLSPSRGPLSFLTNVEREEIIAAFQPQLLDYRLRNWDRVRQSTFEVADVDSELRLLSQILGACILDAPEIQAGVRSMLEGREASVQDARWTDETCVTLEALLYGCHQPSAGKIYVKEIADQTSAILRARGAPLGLEPRAVGAIVRRLGFAPKRDERGFAIRLVPAVARAIHALAFNYNVPTVQNNVRHCDLCVEIFQGCPTEIDGGTQ